jgi:DNA-binding XRE family transcriptional regulator
VLTEDNHDGLTYFDGDRLCQECADNPGPGRETYEHGARTTTANIRVRLENSRVKKRSVYVVMNGERVQSLREEKGLSKRGLAAAAGVSEATLRRVEGEEPVYSLCRAGKDSYAMRARSGGPGCPRRATRTELKEPWIRLRAARRRLAAL